MPSIIKVDQIQSDLGTVNVSSNLQFSSGFSMLSPTLTTPTLSSPTLTTPTTSGVMTLGAGIKFPATQVADSDANTLDDYEEGTWTPSYSPNSGSFTTITQSEQAGAYTKIGRMVTITCRLNRTSTFTVGSASGQVRITGLPFAVGSIGSLGFASVTTQCNGWTTPPNIVIAAEGTTLVACFQNFGFNNDIAEVSDMGTGTETRTNFTLTYFAAA